MINITNEKDCCGCAACSVICPQNCISMKKGSLGHLFPVIDKEKCILCKQCEHVCPMTSSKSENTKYQSAYAAYAKDENIRKNGSSGGIFGTLAGELLLQGYFVYGAAFDQDLKLKCTKAETQAELKILMKSKYLQSDLSGKYLEMKNLLRENKKVLFVSTPCQITALKNYFGKKYDNLITIDFFCHGVPSQEFFDRCKKYVEKKRRIKIIDFKFRAKKKNGVTPHYYEMEFIENGQLKTELKLYFKSIFYNAFQKYINLRESCYNCKFSGRDRNSDITIGDFHEIDNYVKGINRFDGVSTVIINTPVGEELWERCSNKLEVIGMNLELLKQNGICFAGGTRRPENRDEFLNDYKNSSFDKLVNKWMNPRRYWKQEVYYFLPKIMRERIKKYMGA